MNRNGGQNIGGGGKQQRGNEADEGGDVFCAPSSKIIGSSNGDDVVEEMGRADGIGPNSLLSPCSLATSLAQLATPVRESYFSMFMAHDKCAQTIKKVVDPPCFRTLTFVTPRRNSTVAVTPTTVGHPFHFHKPNRLGGRHRLVGKDDSVFDLCHAANLASYRESNRLIEAYMKTGNLHQRRHTLKLLLSKDIILDDTKSIIGGVILDKDTLAAIQLLKSMKTILSKIFRCRRWKNYQ